MRLESFDFRSLFLLFSSRTFHRQAGTGMQTQAHSLAAGCLSKETRLVCNPGCKEEVTFLHCEHKEWLENCDTDIE